MKKLYIKSLIKASIVGLVVYGVIYIISICNSNKNIQMIYEVKQGDSLPKVARKFNTSADKLQKLNGLEDYAVVPGMRLKIDR